MSKIIHGDCLEEMGKMESNSISCVVTDPPYGLKFMGKDWDHGIPGIPYWKEALRISKPGSFLLAFGGTRTYHRLTCAIEDSGWEIRDCIVWLYASGFPKSKGCLKPAYEPIIMARKPGCKVSENFLNIDECRIGTNGEIPKGSGTCTGSINFKSGSKGNGGNVTLNGRWPANIILDEEAGKLLDHQTGSLKRGHLKPVLTHKQNVVYGRFQQANVNEFESNKGGASRFFYCAKASPSERNGSNHPTVKPLKLMEYLIKLVMPPKDGILLDPFAGSGTTILAAKRLGLSAVGIEKEESYCEIANKRIV